MRCSPSALDRLRSGVDAIIEEFSLVDGFPQPVVDAADGFKPPTNPSGQNEAANPAGRMDAADPMARIDATHLPFVTLDPSSSTDLDQAFYLARDGGDLILYYAIADLSEPAPRHGPVETEAWHRGTTVYLPGKRIAQYPEVLSEDRSSLLPDVDRAAVLLTVRVDVDGNATLTGATRAVIRSRAKLGYETAQPNDVSPLLVEFAARTTANDIQRGAERIEQPEQELDVDPNATSGYQLRFRTRTESEIANSALSLAANLAVAGLFLRHGVGLFRDLDAPSASDSRSLRHIANSYGIAWDRSEELSTVVRRLNPHDPKHLAFSLAVRRTGGGATYRFYETIDGQFQPSKRDAEGILVRKLPGASVTKSAKPDVDPIPERAPFHAAMAAPYVHATAPLRRLADRYVLDLAVALMRDEMPTEEERDTLAAVAQVMERAESIAGKVDRACMDLAEACFLEDHIGETFHAVVVDTVKDRATIHIADPAIRVTLRASDVLPGDQLAVTLQSVDVAARRIELDVAR